MIDLPPPGIYRNIPARDYHAWPAASNSTLGRLARSPAHAREALDHPQQSAEMAFGEAFHCAILEPVRFAARYGALPTGDGRTKAVKDAAAALAATGRNALKPDEAAAIHAMNLAIHENETAGNLIALAEAVEVSIRWDWNGVPCKARIDAIAPGLLIDLKTTRDASAESFRWSVKNFGYARQAAFYLRGAATVGLGSDLDFVFIAVEKEPPFAVATYCLPDWIVAEADEELQRLLEIYRECTATNVWSGYPDRIQELEFPRWRKE